MRQGPGVSGSRKDAWGPAQSQAALGTRRGQRSRPRPTRSFRGTLPRTGTCHFSPVSPFCRVPFAPREGTRPALPPCALIPCSTRPAATPRVPASVSPRSPPIHHHPTTTRIPNILTGAAAPGARLPRFSASRPLSRRLSLSFCPVFSAALFHFSHRFLSSARI